MILLHGIPCGSLRGVASLLCCGSRTDEHQELIHSLTRPGKMDLFLNPIPSPNPNELALSRIVPPPMPRSSRRRAVLRLERMQRDLSPIHTSAATSEVAVRRIA